MKRKYRVTVEITKEYEIEIDDEIITEEQLDAFESVFYKLDEEDDRYKSMANDYCRLRAIYGNENFEGYGYPLEHGKVPYMRDKSDVNKGINLTSIDDEGYSYIDVYENDD